MVSDLVKQSENQAIRVHRRVVSQSAIDPHDAVVATNEGLSIDGCASFVELEKQIGKRTPEIGQDVAKERVPARAGAFFADRFARHIREQHEIIRMESEQFSLATQILLASFELRLALTVFPAPPTKGAKIIAPVS